MLGVVAFLAVEGVPMRPSQLCLDRELSGVCVCVCVSVCFSLIFLWSVETSSRRYVTTAVVGVEISCDIRASIWSVESGGISDCR